MQCNVLSDEDKIDFLYGERDPDRTPRVEDHLAACATCREEVDGLGAARTRLAAWTLPGPALAASPRRLGLAVVLPTAAAVILAVSAAFAFRGSEARYEAGHFSFRLGPASDATLRRLLAEQDERHRRDIEALRATIAVPVPASSETSALGGAELARLIRESEARQEQQVSVRLDRFKERVDAQRRLDMARVSAGLSYLDGKNGQQVARTSDLVNYVLQASTAEGGSR
jgi:hypothetical protein